MAVNVAEVEVSVKDYETPPQRIQKKKEEIKNKKIRSRLFCFGLVRFSPPLINERVVLRPRHHRWRTSINPCIQTAPTCVFTYRMQYRALSLINTFSTAVNVMAPTFGGKYRMEEEIVGTGGCGERVSIFNSLRNRKQSSKVPCLWVCTRSRGRRSPSSSSLP